MMISLIAALSANQVIGADNTLPWHLPADLAWFKRNTLNKVVLMGRKTFESIGHALPNRFNIVLSREALPTHSVGHQTRLAWVTSMAEALALANQKIIENAVTQTPEVMVIGGEQIYRQCLPYAKRMYLTHVGVVVKGGVYFPNYASEEWHRLFCEYHHADEKNAYPYHFEILEQKNHLLPESLWE